jgi:DNA-directed RNA polymerase specialized sigma24 family protein
MSRAEPPGAPGPGSPEERLLKAIFGPAYVLPARDDEGEWPAGEREAIVAYLKEEAEALIGLLPPLDRAVLTARLGLGGAGPRPRAEIATALDIPEDQVDVVLGRALRRLRRLEHRNDHP